MLFVVMLGGKHPAAKIEVHDVAFAFGEQLSDCYQQLRQQWFGAAKGLHIDSWWQVQGVDGYQLLFSDVAPKAGDLRLYFINLGGYTTGSFGEDHQYLLVVATNPAEAKQLGKQRMPKLWDKPHTDNLYDVDDCIAIDAVAGRYVKLVPGDYPPAVQGNDYILLW